MAGNQTFPIAEHLAKRRNTSRLCLGVVYANGFLDAMVENYTNAGLALLSVNTRGHDHIADFRIGKTEKIVRMGQAFEIFEECVLDIAAWVEFLKNKGYQKIVLQGHSQGAAKLVYFLSKESQPEIAAMVLMSPPDAPGLSCRKKQRSAVPRWAKWRAESDI